MLKIGDFSRLSQVSIKTLRYYDELGLLRPVEIDPFTGYRYYNASQLPRLNRILVYKGLGFSLDQIAQLLDDNVPSAQIRGMLRLKQAEVQQLIAAEQFRLAMLEGRLKQIELENAAPVYEVVLKKVEPIRVAGLPGIVPDASQIGATFIRLFDEVTDYVYRQGGKIHGPEAEIALFHDLEYREQDINIEAAVSICEPLPASDRVKLCALPAVETMASVIYTGSYSEIYKGYKAILDWIDTHSYRITGSNRKVILEYDRHGDPANYITEIQFPVEKVC